MNQRTAQLILAAFVATFAGCATIPQRQTYYVPAQPAMIVHVVPRAEIESMVPGAVGLSWPTLGIYYLSSSQRTDANGNLLPCFSTTGHEFWHIEGLGGAKFHN